MPILFNFHILLATFYTIFGTNILIQCPVPVPVCCMFYVSQKPHIKRSSNGIKMDGEYFWNIWRIPEEKSTRDGARGRHEAGGAPHPPGRAPDPRGPLVRRLLLFFCRKKANFRKKIFAKVSFCLDSVWYSFSTKHWNRQKTTICTGPSVSRLAPKIV